MIGAFLGSYTALAGVVVCLAAVGGSFYSGYQTGSTRKQGEWDASVLAKKAGEDAALKAAAEAIAKIEVTSETIIQPVRTEIRTNTVYRDCVHPDGVLRNLNSLITGDDSQSAGGGSLSPPNPTH